MIIKSFNEKNDEFYKSLFECINSNKQDQKNYKKLVALYFNVKKYNRIIDQENKKVRQERMNQIEANNEKFQNKSNEGDLKKIIKKNKQKVQQKNDTEHKAFEDLTYLSIQLYILLSTYENSEAIQIKEIFLEFLSVVLFLQRKPYSFINLRGYESFKKEHAIVESQQNKKLEVNHLQEICINNPQFCLAFKYMEIELNTRYEKKREEKEPHEDAQKLETRKKYQYLYLFYLFFLILILLSINLVYVLFFFED